MGEDANVPEFVGRITFDDGEETAVPTQAVLEHIREMNFSIIDSGTLTPTHLGGGFVRLDVDIEALNTDVFVFTDTCIPVEMGDPRDGLRPDVAYYALFEFDEDQENLVGEPQDIDLLTCSPDALMTSRPDDWEIVPTPLVDQGGTEQTSDTQVMTLTEEDGTEKALTFADFDTDPQKLVSIYSKEKERYLTLKDLVGGLAILQASIVVAARMRERRKKGEDVPSLPLAQYAKAEVFQNHDLSAKALDGLYDIAMGEKSYELIPRSGRSKEAYVLTASEDACTKLFQVRGANAEQVRAILGTVHSLAKDPRAAEFAHEGRVWFTVNHIAEELLRTSAGTIKGKDNKTLHNLIDAALEAASGAQIKGTSPDGVSSTVFYLLNAVRLKEVTFNGETYQDVWGIAVNGETLAGYAEGKGHAYHYALPDRAEPFTLDTVGIHAYLSDAMNEARGRLYSVSKTGKVSRKRGTNTVLIKRSWQGGERPIFDLFSPTRVLSSRQKDKLVRGFEAELTGIVRDEAHGERRAGMPLYVRAWSERDGGKGRGKGAYRSLCLEVSTTFRAVRDGENGHGEINLRDGESKKDPDNTPK